MAGGIGADRRHGRQRQGREVGRPAPARRWSPGAECRCGPRRGRPRRNGAGGSHRPRPVPRSRRRSRRRRPPCGDPGARHQAGRRDIPQQRAVDLQRVRRRRRSGRRAGGLGLERDSPRAAVRRTACVRTDRRDPPSAARDLLRAVEAAGETMADQFARRSGVPFVGLRISNIMEPPDYARFESWQDDARIRKWNLWGYVDARDVAQAVARSLEADVRGAEVASSRRPIRACAAPAPTSWPRSTRASSSAGRSGPGDTAGDRPRAGGPGVRAQHSWTE